MSIKKKLGLGIASAALGLSLVGGERLLTLMISQKLAVHLHPEH